MVKSDEESELRRKPSSPTDWRLGRAREGTRRGGKCASQSREEEAKGRSRREPLAKRRQPTAFFLTFHSNAGFLPFSVSFSLSSFSLPSRSCPASSTFSVSPFSLRSAVSDPELVRRISSSDVHTNSLTLVKIITGRYDGTQRGGGNRKEEETRRKLGKVARDMKLSMIDVADVKLQRIRGVRV